MLPPDLLGAYRDKIGLTAWVRLASGREVPALVMDAREVGLNINGDPIVQYRLLFDDGTEGMITPAAIAAFDGWNPADVPE